VTKKPVSFPGLSSRFVVGAHTWSQSHPEACDRVDEVVSLEHVADHARAPWDEDSDSDDSSFMLSGLGDIDPEAMLRAIDEISDRYLSDMESDLIWLMRQGRRPVEISRILSIPECEVVRLRRNCFRKIRTVYLYDYHYDKAAFLSTVPRLLHLNAKQTRIFTMFFNYYGLRQIAETIGTRPSNIHRSLQMMRRKLQDLAALSAMPPFDPFYLNAFHDFKYLCLTLRPLAA